MNSDPVGYNWPATSEWFEPPLTFRQFQMHDIRRQCTAFSRKFTAEQRKEAPLNQQRVATKRDSYGLVGVR